MTNEEYSDQYSQPEEWENILRDVTVCRDRREIPFDPQILPILQERYSLPDLNDVTAQDDACMVLDRDVERVRRAIDRKLHGKMKDCMLLSMLTGWSNARIGTVLSLSKDTVRRQLDSGLDILRTYFRESAERSFPQFHRSRKVLRAALFPLDTDEERRSFQDFVNENIVVHLGYSGGDDFREVMAIYMIPSHQEKT
ncbi:MAG: hypothetical protein ABIH23_35020 [bacterium]